MSELYELLDDLRQDLESMEAADNDRIFIIYQDYAMKDNKELGRKLKEITYFKNKKSKKSQTK